MPNQMFRPLQELRRPHFTLPFHRQAAPCLPNSCNLQPKAASVVLGGFFRIQTTTQTQSSAYFHTVRHGVCAGSLPQ